MRGEEWAGWIVGVFVFGITPACAGKRVLQKGAVAMIAESPPHARGRAPDFAWRISELGITPACAGKSENVNLALRECWNHLRMRGEEGNENAASEDMVIPPKCKFSALFQEPPPSAA